MGKSSKKKKEKRAASSSEANVVQSANRSEHVTDENTALDTSQSNQVAIPNSETNNHVNRISELPLTVLCHILSFLPTRSAVATSILSLRWKYLWLDVPVLDFTDLPSSMKNMDTVVFNQAQYESFKDFMNRVLLLQHAPYIRRLHFKAYDCFARHHVYEWMMVIAKLNVGDLCCIAKNIPGILVSPQILMNKGLLVVFKLHGFSLVLPTSFHLPCLKRLSVVKCDFRISGGSLNVDPWAQFLSNCPVLKELNIFNCKKIEKLTVCSPSIKILRVAFLNNDPKKAILMETPNLEILDLSIGIKRSKMNDLSTLVKARLNTWTSSVRWVKLLERISNAKSLVLQKIIIYGSSEYMQLPIFENLRHLEVGFTAWCIVLQIIRKTPNLESLVINKLMFGWPDKEPREKELPLKRIEYYGFNNIEKGIKVVQYFLNNSAQLEELKIYTRRGIDSRTEIKMLKELLKLWRASNHCGITVMSQDCNSKSDGSFVGNDSESKGPAETVAAETLLKTLLRVK